MTPSPPSHGPTARRGAALGRRAPRAQAEARLHVSDEGVGDEGAAYEGHAVEVEVGHDLGEDGDVAYSGWCGFETLRGNRGRVQTLASPTVNVTSPAISSTADRYWVRLLCLRKQNCFTRITGRSLQLLNIICVGTFRYSRLRLDNARVVTCKHHHHFGLYCTSQNPRAQT